MFYLSDQCNLVMGDHSLLNNRIQFIAEEAQRLRTGRAGLIVGHVDDADAGEG